MNRILINLTLLICMVAPVAYAEDSKVSTASTGTSSISVTIPKIIGIKINSSLASLTAFSAKALSITQNFGVAVLGQTYKVEKASVLTAKQASSKSSQSLIVMPL